MKKKKISTLFISITEIKEKVAKFIAKSFRKLYRTSKRETQICRVFNLSTREMIQKKKKNNKQNQTTLCVCQRLSETHQKRN